MSQEETEWKRRASELDLLKERMQHFQAEHAARSTSADAQSSALLDLRTEVAKFLADMHEVRKISPQ